MDADRQHLCPICTAPAPTANAPLNNTFACPAGQLISTSPYASSAPQTQAVSPTTYACATPVGPLNTTPGVASGTWTPAYACAPACVAPGPSANPPATQTTACPAGQLTPAGAGSFTQTSPVTNTTYACSSPVGSVITTPGTITGAWTPPASSACAPKCVAPPATPNAPITQTTACPAGYTTPSGAGSFVQSQTVSPTTYACPNPTGGYTTTPGVGSGTWTPSGATACSKPVTPPPATCSVTSERMCAAGVVPSPMGNGANCVGGNYSTHASQGGVECVYTLSLTSGGNTQNITNDNPLGSSTYTKTMNVTVGGNAFTIANTTNVPAGTCSGSVTNVATGASCSGAAPPPGTVTGGKVGLVITAATSSPNCYGGAQSGTPWTITCSGNQVSANSQVENARQCGYSAMLQYGGSSQSISVAAPTNNNSGTASWPYTVGGGNFIVQMSWTINPGPNPGQYTNSCQVVAGYTGPN